MECRKLPETTTAIHEEIPGSIKRPNRENPTGILRLDFGKPRKLSAEFKFNQKCPISPQPSILSVTFADDSLKSDSSKGNYVNFGPIANSRMQHSQQPSQQSQQEKVQFPEAANDEESDEEDYSASVNAIIQRRASTRRSKRRSRRTSSPFSPETPVQDGGRRRSSVFTTSSGDTAITVDDNPNIDVTQDEIFENIKLHKEVLSSVKMQPWNMRKKLKLVLQAKAYIKKHEGKLQERLAQSHSTKDMLARWNIVLIKKWQKWKRELTNMSMWFIPWELKIKEIESHFGSVVASYFIFLRWLFWVNIVIAVVIISFVTIPEIITADPEAVKDRKFVLPEEKYNSTNFLTLWDFEGVFKYSPLFYGWYTNRDYNDSAILNSYDKKTNQGHGYRLPFAYFVTGLVVYAYSFFATLRKMAENSRMSKLSEKDDECIFSWKLFTAWDYMIGNAETAHNRVASIVMGFKEALLEEAEKKRESRNWKVICFRVLVNTLVAGLLSFSAFAVIVVVKRSTEPEANSTVWRRNEITIVMSLITLFFPMLFEVLGFVEQYHPRKQLRLQLARIMVLNLLNLYSLIFALFDKITDMTILLQEFKTNLTKPLTTDQNFYTTPLVSETTTQLYDEPTVQCFCNDSLISDQNAVISADMISAIAQNLSNIALPKLKELINIFYEGNLTNFSGNMESSDWNTTIDSFINATEYALGSTLASENSTWKDNNITYLNFNTNTTMFNISDIAVLSENMTTFSYEDVRDMFVDYLTYILSPFVYLNRTHLDETITTNRSNNMSYSLENFTIETVNYSTDNFEYFKTTFLPLFNNTYPKEEQRFETELTTVFEEISATLETVPDLVNTSLFSISSTAPTDFYDEESNSEYCFNFCKSFVDSRTIGTVLNLTTTAMVPYGFADMEYRKSLNYTMNAKLRSLCWETMFGQELIKLTVMDLILTGLSTLAMDFFRGIFVRVMNRCWCWDLEKKFPQYGDFKVAENILHLVNNQGMVWMGMFFSPGLVVLNVIKLYIMMYLRTWAVLTCNVPHEIIFRASRSNNFYYALLLMMLFLCVLPVGYAIVWIEPSWHCGPFSGYQKIFHIFTKTIRANVPESMHRALDYIASPGIVIPLLLLLVLIIYYLVSLTGALREANNDLKTQLRRERTEERRKLFQLADKRRRCGSGESNDQTPFSKWKKLLGNLPSARSCDEPTRQESEDMVPSQKEEEEKVENRSKVFFTKLIKKALGKSSTSEEEQDATDTDQPESLPYDTNKEAKSIREKSVTKSSGGSLELQDIVHKAMSRKNEKKLRKNVISEEKEDSAKDVADKKGDMQDGERDTNKKSIRSKKFAFVEEKNAGQKKNGTDKEQTDFNKKQDGRSRRTTILEDLYDDRDFSTKTGRHKHNSKKKNIGFKENTTKFKPSSGPNRNDVIESQPRPSTSAIVHKKIEKRELLKKIIDSAKKPTPLEIEEKDTFKIKASRQDSSSSIWSTENIPMITISKTESDENILKSPSVKSRHNIEHDRDQSGIKKDNEIKSQGVVEGRSSIKRKFVFKNEDFVDSGEDSELEEEIDIEFKDATPKNPSFRPRVRCVLKKQVTAIDEDVIFHFDDDLKKINAENEIIRDLMQEEIREEENILLSPTYDDEDDIDSKNLSSDKSTSEDTELKEDNSVDTILSSPFVLIREKEDDKELEDYVEEEEAVRSSSEEKDGCYDKSFKGDSVESKPGCSKSDGSVLQLQRSNVTLSSRSQTESSSYYNE